MGSSRSAKRPRRARHRVLAVLSVAIVMAGVAPSRASEALVAPYAEEFSNAGTFCPVGALGNPAGSCTASATASKQDGSFQIAVEVDSGDSGSKPGLGGAAVAQTSLRARHVLGQPASGVRYRVHVLIEQSELFSAAQPGSADASGYLHVGATHASCAPSSAEGRCWSARRLDLPLNAGPLALDLALNSPTDPLPAGEVLVDVYAEGRASLSDSDIATTPGVTIPVPVCPPQFPGIYCGPPWNVGVGPLTASSLASMGQAISSINGKLISIEVSVTAT